MDKTDRLASYAFMSENCRKKKQLEAMRAPLMGAAARVTVEHGPGGLTLDFAAREAGAGKRRLHPPFLPSGRCRFAAARDFQVVAIAVSGRDAIKNVPAGERVSSRENAGEAGFAPQERGRNRRGGIQNGEKDKDYRRKACPCPHSKARPEKEFPKGNARHARFPLVVRTRRPFIGTWRGGDAERAPPRKRPAMKADDGQKRVHPFSKNRDGDPEG